MITAKDHRWMRLALSLLPLSQHPDYRFAAVLVRGGSVVRIGINRNSTAGWYVRLLGTEHSPKGVHAEAAAIHNIKQGARGCTIYVVGRTVRSGVPVICSLPCVSCQRLLKKSGVNRCIYERRTRETGASYSEVRW